MNARENGRILRRKGRSVVTAGVQWMERLGSGDSGVVWGVQRGDSRLALKIVRPRDVEHAAHILAEVERTAKQVWRGVVQVTAAESFDDRLQLEMPWIDGPNVQQVVRGRMNQALGMLPASVAVSWAKELLEILQEMHERGEVHGGVRPVHVVMDGAGQLWLLDPLLFRVDRQLEPGSRARQAPQYASPEAFVGESDDRADQFAVGAMLAEWLTGSPLYAARDPQELLVLAMEGDVSRSVAAVRVYPALAAILQKMLAKRPEARFVSCAEAAFSLAKLSIAGPSREEMAAELVAWSERFRMLEGAEAHFDEIEVPTGTEDSTDDLLFDVTPMVSDTLSSGTPYLGEPERTPVADTWGRQRLRPSETPTAITSPEAVDRERANESVVQATTATPAPSWWQRRRTAFLFGVLVVLIPTVIWFLQRGG